MLLFPILTLNIEKRSQIELKFEINFVEFTQHYNLYSQKKIVDSVAQISKLTFWGQIGPWSTPSGMFIFCG